MSPHVSGKFLRDQVFTMYLVTEVWSVVLHCHGK